MAFEDVRRRLQHLHDDLERLVQRDAEQEVQGPALIILDRVFSDARAYLPADVASSVPEVFDPDLIAENLPTRAADALVICGQIIASLIPDVDGAASEDSPGEPNEDAADGRPDRAVDGEAEVFAKASEAIKANDPDAVEAAFASWIDSANDEGESREDREAFVTLCRFRAGDEAAFDLIRTRAEGDRVWPKAIRYYAFALQDLGEEARAAEIIEDLSPRTSEADQVSLNLLRASMLRRINDPRANEALAEVAWNEDAPIDARVEACVQLAEAYEETDRYASLAFREAALQLDPSSANLRFKLGYAYSEAKLDRAALFHYRRLEQSGTAHAIALNNLGVVLHEVGAPAAGSLRYRRAVDEGSALAAANLSLLAMTAGDLPTADDWLAKGHDLEPAQPNLVGATSRRSALEDSETREIKGALFEGRETQSIFRAALHGGATVELPSGRWSYDGKLLDFVADASGVRSEGSDGDDAEIRITLARASTMVLAEVVRGKYYPSTRVGVAIRLDNDRWNVWLPRDDRDASVQLHMVRAGTPLDEAG